MRVSMEVVNPPANASVLPVPDVAALKQALLEADTPTLLMAYTHLSHDDELLEAFRPHIRPVMFGANDIPEELEARLHAKLIDVVTAPAPATADKPLPEPLMHRMLEVYTGEPVAPEYVPMLLEQSGMTGVQGVDLAQRAPAPEGFKVLIVGAGLCGIAAGVRFQEAGYDYEIIERNDEVGGTWYHTNYPGLAVDTPSHYYSYSFELNANWRHYFTRGYNNQDYLLHTARKYGVRDRVTFGFDVVSAVWDADGKMWDVTIRSTKDGSAQTRRVNAFVTAAGFLREPKPIDIPGHETYSGISMHSAKWQSDVSLEGLRIGVIGTGASSMQLSTSLAKIAKHLTVFQRLKRWVMPVPHLNAEVPEGAKWAMRHIPHYAQWYRLITYWWTSDGLYPSCVIDPEWPHPGRSVSAENDQLRERLLDYIDTQLADYPELKPKVTPDYPAGGTRYCMDAGWFDMLKMDHVELEDSGIERIVENGILTKDGRLIELDAIVYATGYTGRIITAMHIEGVDGQTIEEIWRDPDEIKAHRGFMLPGFPNLFMIGGPGSVPGHGAGVNMLAENQANMILGCFDLMAKAGARAFEVKRESFDRYNDDADDQLRRMIWNHPSIRHRHATPKGRLLGYYPWRLIKAWEDSRRPDPSEYVLS